MQVLALSAVVLVAGVAAAGASSGNQPAVVLRTVAQGSAPASDGPQHIAVYLARSPRSAGPFLRQLPLRDREGRFPERERVLAIDFSRRIVIAVFVPGCPRGGHTLTITNARVHRRRLIVSATLVPPPPPHGGIATFTTPYHVVHTPAKPFTEAPAKGRWTLTLNGQLAARDGVAFQTCASHADKSP